ncbi:MAG: NusG domain II-containing protein [Clostridia bacterium]|nr:NusG domain II-containing protein [Clostridia bacterium]
MKKDRKLLRGADLIPLAVILILCAVLFIMSRSGKKTVAVVVENGKTLYEIDLESVTGEYTIALDSGVTLAVSPGAICFLASDCKGRDCIRCGKLTSPGQTAACLPNKTIVYITGKTDEKTPDAVVY